MYEIVLLLTCVEKKEAVVVESAVTVANCVKVMVVVSVTAAGVAVVVAYTDMVCTGAVAVSWRV